MTTPADALVIGAGVIGLTTAVTLAEAGHPVTVIARDNPDDTTSAAAGALWGPWLVEPRDRVLPWAAHTLDVLTELAADSATTGVRMATGRDVTTGDYAPPDWAGLLIDRRPCTPAEIPAGYTHGTRYTAPLADMPRHLSYLSNRLTSAGGTIQTGTVMSLTEAATSATIVINCTGLGARDLANDPTVYSVRGQHVIVTNPGLTEFLEADTGDSPDLIAIYPHGPHVVLGGTAQPHTYDPMPDESTADAILARCATIEPRLRNAEVIGHRIGHRPTRPTVRLEADETSQALLIHNYGHGGAGYSLAWGCAADVAKLVTAAGRRFWQTFAARRWCRKQPLALLVARMPTRTVGETTGAYNAGCGLGCLAMRHSGCTSLVVERRLSTAREFDRSWPARPCYHGVSWRTAPARLREGVMLDHLTSSGGFFVALVIFVLVVYVTPTVTALIRGVPTEPLLQVMIFNVIPLCWPAALIMAVIVPGRERGLPVALPRMAGYPPDPRYPPGDPRARYPLP